MTMTMKLATGIGSGSDILPLKVNAQEYPDYDFASSMSTASSDGQQEEAPQPPLKSFAKTLWRTKLCKHFLKGTCRFEDKCGFAHSTGVINAKPNLVKTRMCSRFQKGCCSRGENCQFAHGQDELKVVQIVEDAPVVKKLKDDNVGKTEVKPNTKKKMSRMENAKQAMPLDQPMKGGSLEPVKVPLDDALYAFARQTTRPSHKLDVPAAKSMQPNQQETKPAIQGLEEPYYLQSVMQFQPMQPPPGLVGDTRTQALLECQRLRQDLNLDDCQDHLLGALCMGLVNDLKSSAWNSPPVSGYSPSQFKKPAMRGYHSNSMEGINHTAGDFRMTRFEDNMNTLKCNRGGAFGGVPRTINISQSVI